MVIAKQMDVRSHIREYFDMAYDGETVIVPRKQDRNVVIISEERFKELSRSSRLQAYADSFENIRKPALSSTSTQTGSVQMDNLDKLDVISGLTEGWNGNGAPPFSKNLINKIRDLLGLLDIQPEIFPTALQTIQLEFDNSRRDHMEIEIGDGEDVEIFTVFYNGREVTDSISFDASRINQIVRDFYE